MIKGSRPRQSELSGNRKILCCFLYSAATDIMNDPHQVLFQTCCYGNGACVCPVPKVSNDPRCMLHVTLANLEYHLPLKREPLEIQVRLM